MLPRRQPASGRKLQRAHDRPVGQRTDKLEEVKRFRHPDRRQGWLPAAFLDIEAWLRRIRGDRNLSLLRAALQAETCEGEIIHHGRDKTAGR